MSASRPAGGVGAKRLQAPRIPDFEGMHRGVLDDTKARLLLTQCHIPYIENTQQRESNSMSDEILPPPAARGRRRLLQPGQSGNPAVP
jgi:hypothetical protein